MAVIFLSYWGSGDPNRKYSIGSVLQRADNNFFLRFFHKKGIFMDDHNDK